MVCMGLCTLGKGNMITCLPHSLIGSGSVNTLPILFNSANLCTVLKGVVVDKVSTTGT